MSISNTKYPHSYSLERSKQFHGICWGKLDWFSLESGTSPCNALSIRRVHLSGPDCTCVVHPHTPPGPRTRRYGSRLPNRTGVPSSTALSLFLSRPLRPTAVLHGGPVLRSGSTTRERKLYSFHYIFYLDNLVQLESLLSTRGVTFQKLVLSLLFAYTNFHIEFRIFGGCIVEIFLDAWNISSVYFSIAESNESRRRFDIVPTKDLANSKKVTSIATHRNFAITSNYIRANCEF